MVVGVATGRGGEEGGGGTGLGGVAVLRRAEGEGAGGGSRDGAGADLVVGGAGAGGRCGGAVGRGAGPTSRSASRAGGWTSRGGRALSACGARGGADETRGVAAGCGPSPTLTQPDRVVTATVASSAAVVFVRCTRATMAGLPGPWRPGRVRWPARATYVSCAPRVRPAATARADVLCAVCRAPMCRVDVPCVGAVPRWVSRRWRRRSVPAPGPRDRCGGRTPRSYGRRSSGG